MYDNKTQFSTLYSCEYEVRDTQMYIICNFYFALIDIRSLSFIWSQFFSSFFQARSVSVLLSYPVKKFERHAVIFRSHAYPATITSRSLTKWRDLAYINTMSLFEHKSLFQNTDQNKTNAPLFTFFNNNFQKLCGILGISKKAY